MSNNEYCDTQLIYIRKINKNTARDMIVKNHYSHKWTLCRVAYGIFYKSYTESTFFGGYDSKLIGCVVYAQPVGRSAAASISDLLSIKNVFELTRLWIADGYGKNIESFCVAESFRQLNLDFPQIKAVISYADGEQNHRGTIYQALGFKYQGCSSLAIMPNYSVSLTPPPEYGWIHSRTVSDRWGSHNVEHLKRAIGKTFWRKKESTKHRYVRFISNKIENKKLLASVKHPFVEYPKTNTYVDDIEEIVVDSTVKPNDFFG
jgi:hypothetical protein